MFLQNFGKTKKREEKMNEQKPTYVLICWFYSLVNFIYFYKNKPRSIKVDTCFSSFIPDLQPNIERNDFQYIS